MNTITIVVALKNPLNIRRTKDIWLGMDVSYTGAYCRFDAPEYCYRAGAIILHGYERRGINTLQGAITVWAPPSDGNPTQQYIDNVSQWCGVAPTDVIELVSLSVLRAMTRQESGYQPYGDDIIELGISLANPQ